MATISTVDELKAMTPDERQVAVSGMTVAEWDQISPDGKASLLALAADADADIRS